MMKKILCRVISSAPLDESGDVSSFEDSPRIRLENISFPVIYTNRFDPIQLHTGETFAGRVLDCYA